MNAAKGRFITFEGGEGAGKSTQIKLLAERLSKLGYDVILTREPGGSPGAEAVRHVLLSGAAQEFGVRMEAFLFAAARSDHVEQVIRPAVHEGKIVLCDRFADSTRIYQGVTGNIEAQLLQNLERIAVNDMVPDLTLILDVPATEGIKRAKSRSADTETDLDRFEKEELATHEMRREGFLDLAKDEPIRCRVVDGLLAPEALSDVIFDKVELVLPLLPSKAKGKATNKAPNKAKTNRSRSAAP